MKGTTKTGKPETKSLRSIYTKGPGEEKTGEDLLKKSQFYSTLKGFGHMGQRSSGGKKSGRG